MASLTNSWDWTEYMARTSPNQPLNSQRLDKWLWAARFFKTRNLAIEAVNGGKVHVDGHRVKPARLLRLGNEVRVRKGPLEFAVIVLGFAAQRRPAAEASLLYAETEESRTRRETQAEQRKLASLAADRGSGRPTKKNRRQIQRLTGR